MIEESLKTKQESFKSLGPLKTHRLEIGRFPWYWRWWSKWKKPNNVNNVWGV